MSTDNLRQKKAEEHRILSLNVDVESAARTLEDLILRTPSGPRRNALTSMNILLGEIKNQLEHLPPPNQ